MNYRSVVAFGTAKIIADPTRKLEALRIVSDHLIKGRWDDVRQPNEKELKATSVLEFNVEEASAKVRMGLPLDDEEDYSLPTWAGVLPLPMSAGTPVPDPRLTAGAEFPEYARHFRNRAQHNSESDSCASS